MKINSLDFVAEVKFRLESIQLKVSSKFKVTKIIKRMIIIEKIKLKFGNTFSIL
jgi:hypothetical protein